MNIHVHRAEVYSTFQKKTLQKIILWLILYGARSIFIELFNVIKIIANM